MPDKATTVHLGTVITAILISGLFFCSSSVHAQFDDSDWPEPPDELASGALLEIVLGPDPFDPNAPRENVLFSGNALVNRYPMPGYNQHQLSDGRWQIDTELVSVSRTGMSQIFGGEISVNESVVLVSAGSVTQIQPGTDFPAHAVFDVFVEILTPLGTVHNSDPVQMEATINGIPPSGFSDSFMSTDGPVPVWDPSETQILGWIGGPFSPGGACHYNFTSERCLLAAASKTVSQRQGQGLETSPVRALASIILGPDPGDGTPDEILQLDRYSYCI